MKFKVTKILAYGSNHHFMWIKLNDIEYPIHINEKLYCSLKAKGVKTSQYLRWHKHKTENG